MAVVVSPGRRNNTNDFPKEYKNEKGLEILTIKDMRVVYSITPMSEDDKKIQTFIKNQHPGGASIRVYFSNIFGAGNYLYDVGITGIAIKRLSGDQGITNDAHVDREAILKEGIKEFRLGNNYIVTE